MAVEETQRAFAAFARRDGIELGRQRLGWLNQRGHLGLPDNPERHGVVAALERIYLESGGDLGVLADGRTVPLPGDFLHEHSGTLIEIDEFQHFTSWRLRTLQMYPSDAPVGFDLGYYEDLCKRWAARADAYRRAKPARGFGVGGRGRQRAYYDALRDLTAPAMGHPPVIRIVAIEGNPETLYRRHREQLIHLASK